MRNMMLLCLLGLVACGGSPSPAPATPSAPAPAAAATEAAAKPATAALVAPGDAKVGDRTTCPVSGEEFTVTESSPKAEYQGKTYYFCCPGCVEKFNADPAKYGTKK